MIFGILLESEIKNTAHYQRVKIVYTIHIIKRMRRRNILLEEVREAIIRPDVTIKRDGRYFFRKTLRRGTIEVCALRENNLKLLTVYWV
jgi:hypothetical protein